MESGFQVRLVLFKQIVQGLHDTLSILHVLQEPAASIQVSLETRLDNVPAQLMVPVAEASSGIRMHWRIIPALFPALPCFLLRCKTLIELYNEYHKLIPVPLVHLPPGIQQSGSVLTLLSHAPCPRPSALHRSFRSLCEGAPGYEIRVRRIGWGPPRRLSCPHRTVLTDHCGGFEMSKSPHTRLWKMPARRAGGQREGTSSLRYNAVLPKARLYKATRPHWDW